MTEAMLIKMMKAYEVKLLEYMAEDDYSKWSKELAKQMFREEVESMQDSDFKEFILENFEHITK